MDRRTFLRNAGGALALTAALSASGGLISCASTAPDLTTRVQQTEQGVLLNYEIIPRDPELRRKARFANYAFTRLGGNPQYSPSLRDERWLQHYANLESLFTSPLDTFTLEDVDPMFGMFANRVHPTKLIPRYHHTGIDIFKPRGAQVHAVYDGTLEVHLESTEHGTDIKTEDSGNWVKITHPITTADGYQLETRYLHLDAVDPALKTGDRITQGTVLGTLGGTGVMKGHFPHLHFEVVMQNPERPEFPLVLDPNRIYFHPAEPEGFTFFEPSQQLYFRSATANIQRPEVTNQLADTIAALSPHDRRFLPLYVEYWAWAADHGNPSLKADYQMLVDRFGPVVPGAK